MGFSESRRFFSEKNCNNLSRYVLREQKRSDRYFSEQYVMGKMVLDGRMGSIFATSAFL
jgi:hypothetical protein